MEIPVKAPVRCKDGVCGSSEYVLIDPVKEEVTHVVVAESSSPKAERMVPVDLVEQTIEGTIQLSCSIKELHSLGKFVKTDVVEANVPVVFAGLSGGFLGYGIGSYYYWPYVLGQEKVGVPVKQLQIPPGELAIRRGLRVEATDGAVGRVDEFVVNPENGHITHLVMREGHLWGEKDVVIPVSAVSRTGDSAVHLKLDKDQIGSLPNFPVHRKWA
jgi:sporulation protein YlmC with PRC-barrel domain